MSKPDRDQASSAHEESATEETSAASAAASAPEEDAAAPHEPDAERGPSILELLLGQEDASPPALAARVDGIVVGRVVKVEGPGAAHVTFPGAPREGFAARAVAPLGEGDEGREVALMFEGGDPRRPIVMGKMVSPLAAAEGADASADGRRVEITADQEIVLRCGDASITLTRAGKILIRGAYVLSRSSGTNRIQGGSVEIN
jgi:hypothetical protein